MRDNTHAPMEMKHITPDVLMRLSIAFTSGSKFSQSLEKALELIGKIMIVYTSSRFITI